MTGYILSIAERHNPLLGVLVEGYLGGPKIAIGQASLGVRFPAGGKHVAVIDRIVFRSVSG